MNKQPKTVIALDGATDDVVVGATRRGEVVYEACVGHGDERFPRHGTALLAEAERAAAAAGGWASVDRIGVGIGPGSFTGLRIAIATARALAQGRSIALAGVGSLTALAAGVAAATPRPGRPVLPVFDARRGELFAQLHDGSGAPLGEAAVIAPERVGDWLRKEAEGTLASRDEAPLAAGAGALRFARELEAAGVDVLPEADPAHRLAGRRLCELAAAAEGGGVVQIRPLYLREPDAKRWLERDRR